MQVRYFKGFLGIMLIGLLLIPNSLTGSGSAKAQGNKAKGTKTTDTSLVWGKPQPIRRPALKNVKRPAKIVRVPQLTIEWRILKCVDGVDTEVSPQTVFNEGDLWRLAVKANQNGYLYILNQTEGMNGEILFGPEQVFPNSKISNSQDFVKKDVELLLPPRCTPDKERQCHCRWEFDGIAGRELVIIIFSRELLTDLADNRVGGDLIKRSYVAQLKSRWEQQKAAKEIKQTSKPNFDPRQSDSAGRYAIWVTNNNLKNNEELVWIISLFNKGKGVGQ